MIARKETSNHDITSYINKNNLSNKLLPFSCLVKSDASILDCSEHLLKFLGYTISELVGRSLFDIIYERNVTAMFESLQLPNKVRYRKITLKKKNGDLVPSYVQAKNTGNVNSPVTEIIFTFQNGNTHTYKGEK